MLCNNLTVQSPQLFTGDTYVEENSAVLDIQEIVQIDRWFVCLGVKLAAVD